MTRQGPWIQTYTGHQFHFYDPGPEQFEVEDIAHALSLLCRYNGHCRAFYSVAQHSVLVSQLVPEEHALCGLLHDAPEAFVSDVPKPFKTTIAEVFEPVEDSIYRVIAAKFGIPETITDEVHRADRQALLIERRCLLNHQLDWGFPAEWEDDVPDMVIEPLGPQQAHDLFLQRLAELTSSRA